MNTDLNWAEYYKIADRDLPFEDKLSEYVAIAQQRFNADEFYEFCDKHLGHLDEVAHEFFGTEVVRDAIRKKVTALYPEHEIDEFTEMFWNRIQKWRQTESTA